MEQRGYDIKKVGNSEYTLKQHDSMRINSETNYWIWNSHNVSGVGVISFLEKFEGLSRDDAKSTVLQLKGSVEFTKTNYTKPMSNKPKGKIELPEKSETSKRMIAYLTNTRNIDYEIVKNLKSKGVIYEDSKHNVVFLGQDKNGEVKYATRRGTYTYKNKKFVGEVANSDKNYGFNLSSNDVSSKVYVFESPIDAMSHMTLTKQVGLDYTNQNRLSLGGVSDKALEQYLKDNVHIKEITLCLDNDEAGRDATDKIFNKFKDKYIIKVNFPKEGKDYNEYLSKKTEVGGIGKNIANAKNQSKDYKNSNKQSKGKYTMAR